MSKGKNFISEIGKYFKENDANECNEPDNGHNTNAKSLGEKALRAELVMQLVTLQPQVLQLLLFSVSMIHDQECLNFILLRPYAGIADCKTCSIVFFSREGL